MDTDIDFILWFCGFGQEEEKSTIGAGKENGEHFHFIRWDEKHETSSTMSIKCTFLSDLQEI